MFCNNCGAELKDGTLICERCGARQSAGGNGGAGNGSNGGKKSSGGGFGLNKIISVVLVLSLLIGGISYGVFRFKNNAYASGFTHDIEFDKTNLTVQDQNTLRYRDVPSNKTFNVGSEKGFVDVIILDEDNQKVNFNVKKTEKDDRYIVSPINAWDNTHTYYMSLGDDTYFTDEDMYQFNKVIFSIKRDYVAKYEMNKNIIELNEENKKSIKVGDVVHYYDENGKEMYGKVVLNQNGNITYEEPTLADLFESIDLNAVGYPDYNAIKWDEIAKNQFICNFKNSDLYKNIIRMAYADAFERDEETIEAFANSESHEVKLSKIPVDDLCELDVKLTSKTQTKNYFSDIDPDSGNTESLQFEIEISMSPYEGKLFKKSFPDDASITIKISKTIAIAVKSIIDFSIFDIPNTTFDIQLFDYTKDDFDVELSLEKKYKYDDANIEKFNVPVLSMKTENDDTDAKTELFKDGAILNIKAKVGEVLETQKVCTIIPQIPIAIIPIISISADLNLNAGLEGSIKGNINLNSEVKEKYGLELDKSGELKFTKIILKGGGTSLKVDGEVKAKAGINPNVHILLGVPKVYYPVDISFGDEIGMYFNGSGSFHIGEDGNIITDTSLSNVLENSNIDVNLNAKAKVGAEYSYDIGIYGSVFVDGKIKISESLKLLDARYYFINEEFPFIQGGGYANADTKNGAIASDATAFQVGEVGSIIQFGHYDFVVVDKNPSNGTALLVAADGIECKPYNMQKDNTNINVSHTWADSYLREYLNKDFINKFTDEEKNAIYPVKVKGEANEEYNIGGGADSYDQIFILSKSELEKYFKNDKNRQLKASGNAIAQGAYVCTETEVTTHKLAGNTIYWVRNPGNATYNISCVNSDGSINTSGAPESRSDVCVRPALWIRYTIQDKKISERLKNVANGVVEISSEE